MYTQIWCTCVHLIQHIHGFEWFLDILSRRDSFQFWLSLHQSSLYTIYGVSCIIGWHETHSCCDQRWRGQQQHGQGGFPPYGWMTWFSQDSGHAQVGACFTTWRSLTKNSAFFFAFQASRFFKDVAYGHSKKTTCSRTAGDCWHGCVPAGLQRRRNAMGRPGRVDGLFALFPAWCWCNSGGVLLRTPFIDFIDL